MTMDVEPFYYFRVEDIVPWDAVYIVIGGSRLSCDREVPGSNPGRTLWRYRVRVRILLRLRLLGANPGLPSVPCTCRGAGCDLWEGGGDYET